jgi:hypothetical protein
VSTKRDRDGALDQLLRHQARAAAEGDAPGPCLDAETLAAWADGGLKGYGQAMAEAHLAACARCQATLATLTRLSPPPEAQTPERWWEPLLNVRWLAPFAAGALAVLVWIAMPVDRDSSPRSPQATPARAPASPSEQRRATENQEKRAAATTPESKASSTPPVDEGSTNRAKEESDLSASARDERALAKRGNEDLASRLDETSVSRDASPAQPAALPSAPATAAPAGELGAAAKVASMARQIVGGREAASPDQSMRWRVGPAGSIQHSGDNGATWETLPPEVTTDLLGAASPSPTVCWVVGRGGTVLLTTDGRRFRRIPFPASPDLVSVRATDARAATVVSSDGRTFATADGGATWVMNPR